MQLEPPTDSPAEELETKKPYHKPEVIIYGNIREITGNVGAKGFDDGGGGSGAGPKTGK
jgi:hypothetical protein